MDVYVLRHGKAEERSPAVRSDSRRRLTETGKKELRCICSAIRDLDVRLDCVVSSPLLRARQTAEIALLHVKSKKRRAVFWDELRPESGAGEVLKRLSALKPDSSVMLVGHEPLLSGLIASMVSPGGVSISLKKGGFAHVQASARGNAVAGTLRSIMTPRQLKKLCR